MSEQSTDGTEQTPTVEEDDNCHLRETATGHNEVLQVADTSGDDQLAPSDDVTIATELMEGTQGPKILGLTDGQAKFLHARLSEILGVDKYSTDTEQGGADDGC
jgi:hypothetical protein